MINKQGYKLIIGWATTSVWTGPFYPNASSSLYVENPPSPLPPVNLTTQLVCGDPYYPFFDEISQSYVGACLFNIFDDPYEYNNIAKKHPDIVKQLSTRMKYFTNNAFNPDRGTVTVMSW